jgi:hypothetical protein
MLCYQSLGNSKPDGSRCQARTHRVISPILKLHTGVHIKVSVLNELCFVMMKGLPGNSCYQRSIPSSVLLVSERITGSFDPKNSPTSTEDVQR